MRKNNPKKISKKIIRHEQNTSDHGALDQEKAIPKSSYQQKKIEKLAAKERKMPRPKESEAPFSLLPKTKKGNKDTFHKP